MTDTTADQPDAPSSATHRAAVLGHPVAHSLSPALHRAAYDALGLDGWSYEAFDVAEDQLGEFLDGLDDSWVGLSLTMPLKRRVIPLLDELTPLAQALGVVNTVTFHDGRRVGDNTDVYGIRTALEEAGCDRAGWGCVLGGGATAVSAVAALAELGCRTPTLYVRSRGRSRKLREAAARLDVQATVSGWEDAWEALSADVVVSTVPTGAADPLAEELENGTAPTSGPLLLDVVYDPWPTRLAQAWTARGGEVVDGAEMLLHQAVAQVRLMTGQEPPEDAMRAALETARTAAPPPPPDPARAVEAPG
ncbi:MAG: shikimate dehydrogenase [Actinomycetes bacterium]